MIFIAEISLHFTTYINLLRINKIILSSIKIGEFLIILFRNCIDNILQPFSTLHLKCITEDGNLSFYRQYNDHVYFSWRHERRIFNQKFGLSTTTKTNKLYVTDEQRTMYSQDFNQNTGAQIKNIQILISAGFSHRSMSHAKSVYHTLPKINTKKIEPNYRC